MPNATHGTRPTEIGAPRGTEKPALLSPLSPWMDVAGCAAYLGINEQAVYRLVRAGRIPHSKLYEREGTRFNKGEIDRWLLTERAVVRAEEL